MNEHGEVDAEHDLAANSRNHKVECPTCGAVPGRFCRGMGIDEVHYTRAMAADEWFKTPCEHNCAQCEASASFDIRMNGAAATMLRELGWLRRVLDGEVSRADALMSQRMTASQYDLNRGNRQMAVNVRDIVVDIINHHRDAILRAANLPIPPEQQESR